MSIVTVSPGVFTQENDLSFVPQGIAAIGAATIGLTEKGPAFQPIKITGFNDFRTQFGNLNPKMFVSYAAKQYLQNADQLIVTRVLGTKTSVDVGKAIILAFGNTGLTTTLTSAATAMAILRSRSNITTTTISGTPNNFTLTIDSISAGGLSLNKSDGTYIGKVLGTNSFAPAAGDLLPTVYVESIFDYAYFASSGVVTGNALANSSFSTGLGGYKAAETPVIVSQNYNGQVFDLFKLIALSDGDSSNFDIKISISVEQSQIDISEYPQFTVIVRRYDDADDRIVVLESFNCTLNPISNDYIKRVIGDRYKTFNTNIDPPEIIFEGEFDNKSKYIRVETYDGYPLNSKPSGFKAISAMSVGPVFKIPYKNNHINFAGVKDKKIYMGFDSTINGASDRLSFLVTGISATATNIAKGILISTLSAENSATATLTDSYVLVNATTDSPLSATDYYNYIKFTVPMFGGWDGIDERKDKLNIIADGTLSAEFYNAIKILGNPDELDFNLLTIPGIFAGGPASQGNISSKAVDMVSTRGDAFYIMDIGNNTISTITGAVMNSTVDGVVETAKAFDTNYAASYFPSVRILDTDNNKFIWVPASVVVFGAYAFNDRVGQPWFAPAGLNRGILNVFEARKRLTQTQRDTLYLGKVNPIATFAGQGIVVWGQKTLQAKSSALDRVNVRRLLLTARKLISSVSKYFVFEPNNGKTRSDITNTINPILERIQINQGIEQFRVIVDETNNTPDMIDRNIIVGDIFIQPTKTSEIFLFNFNITRSGVTFGE